MKTKLILVAFILVFAGFACTKENTNLTNTGYEKASVKTALVKTALDVLPEELIPQEKCGETSYDLIAGQDIHTGTMDVFVNEENLYISFHTTDGWHIKTTHLFIGQLSEVPVNNSNIPVPGKFPFQNSFDPYVDIVTYKVPLADILVDENKCFIIAAHADVVKCEQTETAWSDGITFNDAFGIDRWGFLSQYCQQECNECVFEPVEINIIRNDVTTGGDAFNGIIGTATVEKDEENSQYIVSFKLLENISFYSPEKSCNKTGYWGLNEICLTVMDLEGNTLWHLSVNLWNPSSWHTVNDVKTALNSYQIIVPFENLGDNNCIKMVLAAKTRLFFDDGCFVYDYENITDCHPSTGFSDGEGNHFATICKCQ